MRISSEALETIQQDPLTDLKTLVAVLNQEDCLHCASPDCDRASQDFIGLYTDNQLTEILESDEFHMIVQNLPPAYQLIFDAVRNEAIATLVALQAAKQMQSPLTPPELPPMIGGFGFN